MISRLGAKLSATSGSLNRRIVWLAGQGCQNHPISVKLQKSGPFKEQHLGAKLYRPTTTDIWKTSIYLICQCMEPICQPCLSPRSKNAHTGLSGWPQMGQILYFSYHNNMSVLKYTEIISELSTLCPNLTSLRLSPLWSGLVVGISKAIYRILIFL